MPRCVKPVLWLLIGGMLGLGGVLAAADLTDLSLWKGNDGGNAAQPPQLSLVDAPSGRAIQAQVVAPGGYQGMDLQLPEAIDTSSIAGIEFDFFQNAIGMDGTASLMAAYENGGGIFLQFRHRYNQWNHVFIPLDLRSYQPMGHASPKHGMLKKLTFSIYDALDTPSETLRVANLKFVPKAAGNFKIPVPYYQHRNLPPQGDASGKTMTDGILDEEQQIRFPHYSNDPDIDFDLGGIYLVDAVKVGAIAVPSQNIAELFIESSMDGKTFKTVGHITNSNTSGQKERYTISGQNLKLLGRYFRVRIGRSRTDFPVALGEVEFYGKLPTDEEFRRANAAGAYDLGPALPVLNADNYWMLESSGGKMAVCKKNGVIVGLSEDGRTIAERIWGVYKLSDGRKTVSADDYSAQIIDSQMKDGKLITTFTIPQLSGIVFSRTTGWSDGNFSSRLEFQSKRTDRQILQTSLKVIIPQTLRRGGLYETWGSGHTMTHRFADEFSMDLPAASESVVVFENAAQSLTLLNYRYKYKDRFIRLGAGVITVAGFGDKTTIFTENGWLFCDGVFEVNPAHRTGSVESRLLAVKGDLTHAFDKYLEQPEAHNFHFSIQRPQWVEDVRFFTGMNWGEFWGDNLVRLADNSQKIIREGIMQIQTSHDGFSWGDWNDFLTSGIHRNHFGGEMTAQEVRDRLKKTREAAPGAKLSTYTWLWSATKGSKVFKEHKDWFITHNVQGGEISFFPGDFALNYYWMLSPEGSYAEMFRQVTETVKGLDMDIWYLDGGGSPATIDWVKLRIDEPDSYDRLFADIRKEIRKDGDRGIFFNHPENPLADFGFLESTSEILSNNWRDGATYMYRFKLWQRPDPKFTPLYIYWTGESDLSYRRYVVATGLGLVFTNSWQDKRPYVGLISARQQSRKTQMVSANIQPNWRYDYDTSWELMPLTFGNSGWLMVRSHYKDTRSGKFACDLAPLGITDKALPVYYYNFEMVPHAEHKGIIPEPEAENAYAQTQFQSDFIISTAYAGSKPYSDRMEQEFALPANGMRLCYATQSPALVWSTDNLRCQIPMSETLGVKTSGAVQGEKISLKVESEREKAEIIVLLPSGCMAGKATVNGTAVDPVPLIAYGAEFVRISVPKGNSDVAVDLVKAIEAPVGDYRLAVPEAGPGATLNIQVTTPAMDRMVPACVVITQKNIPVWHRAITLQGTEANVALTLPEVLTGDTYQVSIYDLTGRKLAGCDVALRNGAPKLAPYGYPHFPSEYKQEKVSAQAAAPGINVIGTAAEWSEGEVVVNPEKASIKLQSPKMLNSNYGVLAGALEVEAKRYIKVRLNGNFDWYAENGLAINTWNISLCYGDLPTCSALTFDFETPAGYTTRSFAGVGMIFAERNAKTPESYGTKEIPQFISSISLFCRGKNGNEEEHWLDCRELGAPQNWTGKLYVGGCWQNPTPARFLEITLLESRDTLPQGAELTRPFFLKGGQNKVVEQTVDVPRVSGKITIDGKMTEDAWRNAPEFTDFSLLDMPAVKAPLTRIKMLSDDEFIYIAAELHDPDRVINAAAKQPFQADGIEVYLGRGKGNPYCDQYILASGKSFMALRHLPDGKNTPLPEIEWAEITAGHNLTIEAAFPKKIKNDDPAFNAFNVGRNRVGDGNDQLYTLTPGRVYRNLEGYKFGSI